MNIEAAEDRDPGFLPFIWCSGAGSETMRRIAAPMVGGMVTSTVLTLVVIPAIYFLWKSKDLQSVPEEEEQKGK
ncbi:MAG: efflux RND transporter permease subunit [Ignavibacteria bacterium]|nr:efflux RND transporter permease subunit [Ignavibacteria bacterium]